MPYVPLPLDCPEIFDALVTDSQGLYPPRLPWQSCMIAFMYSITVQILKNEPRITEHILPAPTVHTDLQTLHCRSPALPMPIHQTSYRLCQQREQRPSPSNTGSGSTKNTRPQSQTLVSNCSCDISRMEIASSENGLLPERQCQETTGNTPEQVVIRLLRARIVVFPGAQMSCGRYRGPSHVIHRPT